MDESEDLERTEELYRGLRSAGRADLGWRDGSDVAALPATVMRDALVRLAITAEPRSGQVMLTGVRLAGTLDLHHRELPFALLLDRCWFEDGVTLDWARTRGMRFTDCRLERISARDAQVDGDLALVECRSGALDLQFARIAGRLHVAGGTVEAGGAPRALDATGLTASGSIRLESVRIDGQVDLVAATAGRLVSLNDAHLSNPGGAALDASRLRVDGPVFGRRLRAEGGITLRRAEVAGFVDLEETQITDSSGSALFAPGLRADGGLYLSSVRFDDAVFLLDARVGVSCSFEGATIRSQRGAAIDASRMTVTGPLFMNEGMSVDGGIVLRRARVSEFTTLEGAHLRRGSQPVALWAPVLRVDILQAEGATIEGGIDLVAGEAGVVDLDGLDPASTDVDLRFAGLTTDQLRLPAHATVNTVDLRRARVSLLETGPGPLPRARVEGLVAGDLRPIPSPDETCRLIRSIDDDYSPQPYEQFAALYRRLGHDDDARAILRAKQRHRRTGFSPSARTWSVLQDVLVGYGYRPGRAAAWLVALLLLGTATFTLAPPSAGRQAPPFNAIVYSWDLLVPVGDYGQQQAYTPNGAGQWVAAFLISAGWLLATACIAGITRTLNRA